MRKFLSAFISICTIVIALNILLGIIYPYYIGEIIYPYKNKYLEKNINSYNSVVFGSSRMWRQFDTHIFDSVLSDDKLFTYNMATGGTFNPEAYYLYKKFISELDSGQIKLAIIELQAFTPIADENIKTVKGNYWLNTQMLKYCINYINGNQDDSIVFDLKSKYIQAYLYNLNNFSKLKNWFSLLISDKSFFVENNGHSTFEDQIVRGGVKSLRNRNNEFLDDTTVLTERISAASNLDLYKNYTLNNVHLDILLDMINLSAAKGIKVIFILPPRLTSESYKELMPVFMKLSDSDIINLASYNEFSDFYTVENSFDIGHLNKDGAYRFTKEVANRVKNIIRKQK